MKKIYIFLMLCVLSAANCQVVNFGTSNQFRLRMIGSNTIGGIAYDINGAHMKADANGNGQIEITEALAVYEIRIADNSSMQGLTGLEFFTNLRVFTAKNIGITTVNLQPLTNLRYVDLYGNNFTSVNLEGLVNLTDIKITQTSITSLNITGLSSLVNVDISHNHINTHLDVSAKPSLVNFDAGYNDVQSITLTGSANINRLNLINNSIDEIDVTELTSLVYLNVLGNGLNELDVNGLVNLETLACDNNNFTQLDVQSLTNLKTLSCSNNDITSLNVQGLTHIEEITAFNNEISEMNVQGLTTLKTINITNNHFGTFDARGLPLLKFLYCASNGLTNLHVSGLSALEYLVCNNNHLAILDLSGMERLAHLTCNDNFLTTLNLESCRWLSQLKCQNNLLTALYLKNGTTESVIFENNPGLSYICCDQSQVNSFQTQANQNGYAGIEVNSYCNEIGQWNYGVEGTVNLYSSANYTNETATPVHYLRLYNSHGGISTTTNTSGFYSFGLPTTINNGILTPMFENPALFGTSNLNYTLQYYNEVLTKNIAIWPAITSVNTPDIEAVLIPFGEARPGENTQYTILIRNKGNTVVSGSASLVFDDSVLDFVSSNTAINVQPGVLTLSFQNLPLFGSTTAKVTFKVNRPTDNPPVDQGFPLQYLLTATLSEGIDYNPSDNIFVYGEKVVNSYDPNDKKCLQGELIPLTDVGKYVHYLIRFENLGTANANRVIVTDELDTSKFNINSLIPIASSHEYVTNISGNKVEFIFDDINLPFDDENNDGYICFKVKTASTLVQGSTFSNFAKIYFDYNFPIITNTYITSVAVPQPPVIAGGQQFCFGAVLADIALANPVDTIQWYTSQTGGTPLDNQSLIVDGVTYYASKIINAIESTGRTAVTVIVSTTTLPVVASAQGFCGSATISDIETEAVQPRWYASATENSELAQDAVLQNGGIYYLSQTINGCESTRVPVEITLTNTALPLAQTSQHFCGDSTLADIIVQDGAGIRWYASQTSTEELSPDTVLAHNSLYYISQTINGCESGRVGITVTVTNSIAPSGEVVQDLAQGSLLSDIELVTTGTLRWYASAEDALNGENILSNNQIIPEGTTTFYATQIINGCESEPFAITVSSILSSEDFKKDKLLLYPNPVIDHLYIANDVNIIQIEIYNYLGQQVYTSKTEIGHIDMSDYPTGAYLVKIYSRDTSEVIKIIKQ